MTSTNKHVHHATFAMIVTDLVIATIATVDLVTATINVVDRVIAMITIQIANDATKPANHAALRANQQTVATMVANT